MSLKSINNFEIFEKDIYELNTFLELKNKFDVIFLDPPYKDNKIDVLFKNIQDSKILKKRIVILHSIKRKKTFCHCNLILLKKKDMEYQRYYFF